jgi:hypothetical protein
MGQTFADLLDDLTAATQGQYRSDPERYETVLRVMAITMQTMLEKLRDLHDRR